MYSVGFKTCRFEIVSRRPPTSSVVAFQYVYIYSCSNGSISVQFGRNYFHQKKISVGVDFYNLRCEMIWDGWVSSDNNQMQNQLINNDNNKTKDTDQQIQLHLARIQAGMNTPKNSRIMNFMEA